MTMEVTSKKILFVSARLPFPAVEGHQIRAYGVLKQLSRYSEVHLLSILRPGEKIELNNELSNICHSIVGVPLNTGLFNNIKAVSRSFKNALPLVVSKYVSNELKRTFKKRIDEIKPDIVHLDLLMLAELIDCIPANGMKVILNEHNVESDLIKQKIDTLTNPMARIIYRREFKLLLDFEKRACQKSDTVLACSDNDRLVLQELGARDVHTIPNGVDTSKLTPCLKNFNSNHIVFLGGMGWYPNRLGIEWFLNHVLEKIVDKNPNTHLHLIGNPDPLVEVPKHLSKHVTKHGFVDDFTKIVGASGIMIVPLHVGSGTRLKVVEAASMGCCMVSTRKGAEGVKLSHGESIMFADSAEDFSSTVLALQKSPDNIVRIGNQARKIAERIYDWYAIGDQLHEIYYENRIVKQVRA